MHFLNRLKLTILKLKLVNINYLNNSLSRIYLNITKQKLFSYIIYYYLKIYNIK